MKKVIFLCLVTLSVCLSKPNENQASPNSTLPNASATLKPTENITAASITGNQTVSPNKEKEAEVPPVHTTEKEKDKENIAPPLVHSNETLTSTSTPSKAASDTPKPADNNKTTGKEGSPKAKEETDPTKNGTDTKPAPDKASTDVKPDEGTAKNGTNPETKDVTPKPETPTKPTEAPKADKDKHVVQARSFDGPSFIGGIILTLGLLAIGFMGFKYYKNQTERNYHTL